MHSGIKRYFNYRYPKNYILRKPLQGGLIIAASCFAFSIIYKPLGSHPAKTFSFETTMAIYWIMTGVATVLLGFLLKRIKWFQDEKGWTFLKELAALLVVLTWIGLVIYFMGFIVEEPAPRWNILTFLDSLSHGYLTGIIPLMFFTIINYSYLFPEKTFTPLNTGERTVTNQQKEEMIRISSQLKKESLSFFPSELIYAESDGNYVNFYLSRQASPRKEIIRNSINNIEQQLSGIPYFMRTHRAFIVNLNKVTGKHGTTLGYSLKLSGTETRVPVSRSNTRKFNTSLPSRVN